MNFNVDIDKIAEDAISNFKERIRDNVEKQTDKYIQTLFDSGQWYGHKKGLGYTMIEKALDDFVLGADFEIMAKDFAKECFETHLKDQLDYQLRRKAQKEAARITRQTVSQ